MCHLYLNRAEFFKHIFIGGGHSTNVYKEAATEEFSRFEGLDSIL